MTYTILCVDDENSILNSLQRVLMSEGYNVVLALSGQEALDILTKTEAHVIISDQRMPEMSGHELLTTVKEKYPRVMRIILSGYSDFDSLVKSVNEGEIFRFIYKPWETKNLIEIIKDAIKQREVLTHIDTLVDKFRDITSASENMAIETYQEKNIVSLKATRKENDSSHESVSSLLKLIFEAFKVEADEQEHIIAKIAAQDKDKAHFEVELGQGILLKVEVPTTNPS